MVKETKGMELKEAFDLSQKPHQNHSKIVTLLRETYNKIEDKSIFLEEFIYLLKYPLIVYRREPSVERVMDFVAKFVTSFHSSGDEDEIEADEENSPVNYIFNFLLQSHGANSMAVRFRVCQLINKLLVNLPENAQIDDDLFDKIHDAMMVRLTDRVPNVRIQAVLALARLQDPSDLNCPVSNDAVKEVMQKKLIQSWLRYTEGDVLELLHRLDVENSPDVAMSALNALFSVSSINELVQNCKNLDERKLIPMESLTPENVLYWKALCEYLKSKSDEGEAALENILPEPAVYSSYLSSYLQTLPVLTEEEKADITKIEDLMTKEFIGHQLILTIGCLDTSEEGGRKRLLAVLQEILVKPNTSTTLISPLVELLLSIIKDDDKRIQIVAEIISELREPIISVDNPKDAAESRRLQLKLAEVKVQLIETKQALEDSLNVEDYSRASELKEKVKELESLKSQLTKEAEQPEIKEIRVEKNDPETLLKCLIMCNELLKHMSLSKGLGGTLNEIIESLILPGITNVHPSVRNMAVLCIGCCALQNKDFARQHLPLLLQISQLDEVKVKTSALNAVFDMLLLFGLDILKEKTTKPDDSLDAEEEVSEEEKTESVDDIKISEEVKEDTATVNGILQLFSTFLDSEIPEIRTETAEGLSKLMFSGRLISAKLLSRLILLWYNPVTEEDTKLRHCLGVFFPIFAYSCRSNQECYEEAFFPTLQTLFNAPASSPLADIDIANVAELLVDLTRPSGLNPQNKSQEYQAATVHDGLAIKICNEILKDPTAPDVRIYAKALCSLEITKNISTDLLPLLDCALEDVTDKLCERAIEKVRIQLNSCRVETLVSKETEETNNLQEAEQEKQKDEVNSDEENSDTVKQKSVKGKPNKGRRKGSTATNRRKAKFENVEAKSNKEEQSQSIPVNTRPSRRAKTAAMEKTKIISQSFLTKKQINLCFQSAKKFKIEMFFSSE
ncbi:hypothetical protein GDO86_000248 [Hymenochirus boettgeri]|uniref:Nuclear condensin complex subunit 3 C-terminal domain-containing protein n=1 Tax=Hymenochirus boettgeri TaxID=247094 RepID=A0A8T2KB92_9PIPI|nr:hypothetical protein GDO86_000248 [Hymenochirus boettgeri]